jgi:hypothetical protein
MSAVYVPSGMVFGVTPMPANPVSPFRAVKVERYVPGGGSNGAGDVVVGVVEEEHAPMSSVQTMKGARNRIDRSRSVALAHAGLFVIEYSLLSLKLPDIKTSDGLKRA